MANCVIQCAMRLDVLNLATKLFANRAQEGKLIEQQVGKLMTIKVHWFTTKVLLVRISRMCSDLHAELNGQGYGPPN